MARYQEPFAIGSWKLYYYGDGDHETCVFIILFTHWRQIRRGNPLWTRFAWYFVEITIAFILFKFQRCNVEVIFLCQDIQILVTHINFFTISTFFLGYLNLLFELYFFCGWHLYLAILLFWVLTRHCFDKCWYYLKFSEIDNLEELLYYLIGQFPLVLYAIYYYVNQNG